MFYLKKIIFILGPLGFLYYFHDSFFSNSYFYNGTKNILFIYLFLLKIVVFLGFNLCWLN